MSRGLWVPVVSGPLEPYAAGYWSWLSERGYAGRTVVNRLELLGLLSRWLEQEDMAVEELTAERVERFLAVRHAAGYSRCASARSSVLPLGYLRGLGVVPAAVVAVGPVERLLDDYRRYLFQERGLGKRIVLESYVPTARAFLSGRVEPGGVALWDLSAGDVSAFLASECRHRGVDSTRNLASGLRCLLRYLRMAGLIELPLEWTVPGVADLRDRSLPRGVGRETVARLLGVFDRRSGWSAGAITRSCCCCGGWGCAPGRSPRSLWMTSTGAPVRSWCAGRAAGMTGSRSRPMSARRSSVPPAPSTGGEPARVPTCCRAGPGDRSQTVGWIVRSACRRAGVTPVGAHALRHTAATEMLGAGASLSEIGQVLRHREQRTTARLRDGRPRGATARPALAADGSRCGMTALRQALDDYLRIRRQLGFTLICDRSGSSTSSSGSSSRPARNGSRPSWPSHGHSCRATLTRTAGDSGSGSCAGSLVILRRSIPKARSRRSAC